MWAYSEARCDHARPVDLRAWGKMGDLGLQSVTLFFPSIKKAVRGNSQTAMVAASSKRRVAPTRRGSHSMTIPTIPFVDNHALENMEDR